MWGSLSNTLDTLLALQNAMEHASDKDFFGSGTASRGVHPLINVFEKEGDLMVVAELAGMRKEDVSIEIKGNQLRISGERKIDYGEGVSRHRIERQSKKFDRSLKLPFNVNADNVHAELQNGLLVLSLPRAESDKPRQIAIS